MENSAVKKVPSILVMPLIEIVYAIVSVVAIILSLFFLCGSLFTVVFSTKTAANALKAAGGVWKPWLSHWKLYGWIFRVWGGEPNDISRFIMEDINRPSRPRTVHYYKPTVDPGEILYDMWAAANFAYCGTVIVITILGLCGVFSAPIVVKHFNHNVKPEAVKPLKTPEYKPSDIQKQEVDFGPFFDQKDVDKLRAKAGVNNLALVSDEGAVRYSQNWTIDPGDKAWTPSATPFVTSQELKGTAITFEDDKRTKFCINICQPFYFENKPTCVYIFDKDGQLRQAMRNDVKKVSTTKVKSNAKSNPDLSIL